MKPKVIVLDLDGTLLNSEKKISMRNLSTLKKILRKNIKLIFATARPPRVVMFDNVNLRELGSMVYYNGAYINCNQSKIDHHIGINAKLGADIIEYATYLDDNANISVEIKDKWYSYKQLDYRDFMRVKKNPELMDVEEIKSRELTKILITDFKYSKELKTKYNDLVNMIITDNEKLIQIMAKEAGKEKAVRKVIEELGFIMDEVACFGDDYNDLELFKECGYSIAMGNGITELKDISDEVTKTNDEDGVAVVLERLVLKGFL